MRDRGASPGPKGGPRERTTARWAVIATLAALAAPAGCDEPCCEIDTAPIPLTRAPTGELLLSLELEDGSLAPAVLDTGFPVTLWNAASTGLRPRLRRRTLRLASPEGALRGVFRGAATFDAPLSTVGGGPDEPFMPAALVGAELLAGFSTMFDFSAPAITLHNRQPATSSYLAAAGYAVLRLPRYGGGDLPIQPYWDGLSRKDSYEFPGLRMVVRGCAAPSRFGREDLLPECCARGEEQRHVTGADVALVLSTGVGPIVLSRSAYERVRTALGSAAPVVAEPGEQRPLRVAGYAQPFDAEWVTLPRLALVDREAAENDGAGGACAELSRARRLEQVAFRQWQSQLAGLTSAACALPCDTEQRTGLSAPRAHDSAAYVEVGGTLEVAIVDDTAALLQSVRAEVRPEGPEVDGLLGASALRAVRLEVDPAGQETRGLFSCERGADPGACRSVPRCPGLPDAVQQRACYGLSPHGLPRMCESASPTCL